MELITLEKVPGFKIATVAAKIKNWNRNDMAIIVSDKPAPCAGIFTKNKVVAAPVIVSKKNLKVTSGVARAILVNAAVANACTGDKGIKDTQDAISMVANSLKFPVDQTLMCSTGVIGKNLPMDKISKGIEKIVKNLGKAKPGDFAKAIMTTDLVEKQAGIRIKELNDAIIAGACKGSGMIAPNMATMLAFILTDQKILPKVLKKALAIVKDDTFNAVTVDGDTSTNDTLLIMSSGLGKGKFITKTTGKRFESFVEGLHEVCLSLAKQIAKDGEGATKLVQVIVKGAKKQSQAKTIAKTIAESPLVKTALYGNDPNWGRIMAAAGRSGVEIEPEKINIKLAGETVFKNGMGIQFDKELLSNKMKVKELTLEIDLDAGKKQSIIYTCDLSYDYVKINADYTT